jgi:microcystin-dependent protein
VTTSLYRKKGEQFFDANGRPLTGGYLYFYIANTTTLQDTYSDSAGATANTNPIPLDGSGRLLTPIYLGSTNAYKELLTDVNNVTVSPWPFDNIPPAEGASSPLSGFERIYLPWTQVTHSDSPVAVQVLSAGAAYEADATAGDIDFDLPAASAIQNGTGYFFKRTDASANVVTVTPLGGDTIDGVNAPTTIPPGYNGIYMVSDGVQWLAFIGITPSAFTPRTIGLVGYFPGTTVPAGWLKANGQTVSRVTYASLWAFANASGNIASEVDWAAGQWGAFSVGNGSTTFRLPDLRGFFPCGWADDAAGPVDAGRTAGSFQDQATLIHTHTPGVTDLGHKHGMFSQVNTGVGLDTLNIVPSASNNLTGTAIDYIITNGDLNASVGSTGTNLSAPVSVSIAYTGGTKGVPQNVALMACISYV